jgi:hypothetical protein
MPKKAKSKSRGKGREIRTTGFKCPHCGLPIPLELVFAPEPRGLTPKLAASAAKLPQQVIVALLLPCQGGTVRKYCPTCMQWYCLKPTQSTCPQGHPLNVTP